MALHPIQTKPLLLIAIILCVAFMGVGMWTVPPLNAQRDECDVGRPFQVTLAANAGWDLCWSVAEGEGLVLHDIHYTAPNSVRRKVMKEASVAQIIISPDEPDAAQPASQHLINDRGLGGDNLLPLDVNHCPDGQIHAWEERNILCQRVVPRGYIYRYFDKQRQGEYISLYAISVIDTVINTVIDAGADEAAEGTGNQTQILVEWRFYDDGTIEPIVDLTGPDPDAHSDHTSSTEGDSSGAIYSAFWRLDIDIGANGDDDVVEEIEVLETDENRRRSASIRLFEAETAREVNPESKRSWRVRAGSLANPDGHVISYQLEARNVGHQLLGSAEAPWHQQQLYVTVQKECERLATQNPAGDLQDAPCPNGVANFVDGESLTGQDPVLWYGASVYRSGLVTPSQTPQAGSLSFLLLPRDWTAVNPLVE